MNYLQQIIENKRREIEKAKKSRPASSFDLSGIRPGPVSLKTFIRENRPAIIAEIKRRSPSKGELRDIKNPAGLALSYEQAGAAGISVLTDRKYFGGDLDDLQNVKSKVTVPVLRKDFIIDTYQVFESKQYGADALLLITGCLSRLQLSELLDSAHGLGLEVLVETENEEDIAKIEGLAADIIGVNNRNLRSFGQTLDNSFRLFDSLPASCVKISESALKDAGQMIELDKTGYDGFLIGETLMRANSPGEKLAKIINDYKTIYEKAAY